MRSDQKLPIAEPSRARRSRGSTAMSTAMPTAAETKFCTASPAICVKFVIVVSPP